MTQGDSRELRTRDGNWISPQLAAESADRGEPERRAAALLAEVRRILEHEQDKHGRRPIAEELP